MRVQYMSDLHLERCRYEFQFPKKAPCLVLGGDIGRLSDYEHYAEFIFKQCDRYDHVVVVLGNHEFYGCDHEEAITKATNLAIDQRTQQKLKLLYRGAWEIPGTNTVLLGCTLYSRISPYCTKLSADFKRIAGWSIEKHNNEHQLDLSWLRSRIKAVSSVSPKKKIIVVTHFSPCFEGTSSPVHQSREGSECFSSNTLNAVQDEFPEARLTHWISGHTHWNCRFRRGMTLVLSNQMMLDTEGIGWFEKMQRRSFKSSATLTIK